MPLCISRSVALLEAMPVHLGQPTGSYGYNSGAQPCKQEHSIPLGEAPEDGIDLTPAVDLEEGLRARFCDSRMRL